MWPGSWGRGARIGKDIEVAHLRQPLSKLVGQGGQGSADPVRRRRGDDGASSAGEWLNMGGDVAGGQVVAAGGGEGGEARLEGESA